MDKYLAAIKKNICSICVDSNSKGKCQLSAKEYCAVELFLPRVVELIHSKHSDKPEDHILLLREKVCVECREGKNTGYCSLREDVNCSLDRYYPLIVETVMNVDKKVYL